MLPDPNLQLSLRPKKEIKSVLFTAHPELADSVLLLKGFQLNMAEINSDQKIDSIIIKEEKEEELQRSPKITFESPGTRQEDKAVTLNISDVLFLVDLGEESGLCLHNLHETRNTASNQQPSKSN